MADMNPNTFAMEFACDIDQPVESLQREAEDRLSKLASNRWDITRVAVALSEVTHDTTPHTYRARVVVYMRPENVASTKEENNPSLALKEALSAVERQVRDLRQKLRQRPRVESSRSL